MLLAVPKLWSPAGRERGTGPRRLPYVLRKLGQPPGGAEARAVGCSESERLERQGPHLFPVPRTWGLAGAGGPRPGPPHGTGRRPFAAVWALLPSGMGDAALARASRFLSR